MDNLKKVRMDELRTQLHEMDVSSMGGDGLMFPDEFLSMMFDICKLEDGKACVSLFLDEVRRTGIRVSDPRLKNMIRLLNNLKAPGLNSIEDLKLDANSFKSVLNENMVLITKALSNQMIIPAFDAFCENIAAIYEKCKELDSGTCGIHGDAGSEMEEKWGVSICTVDGQRFSIGDANEAFPVQSTSTPVTYGICLNELGEDLTHKYQGRESSGRDSNEIVLGPSGKPFNPYINSGALMSAALILKLVRPDLKDMASKFDYVHEFFRDMAGDEHVGFNNSSFLAERNMADRNYSLAYFMRENGCFPKGTDINKVLEFYCQLCSLELTCESASVVAATIANGGVCPITSKKVLNPENVLNVRSLMYSCGMYNYSGKFAFMVGLPAKAGGSGSLMVVIPNVMGISLWSPPLDGHGNSVRGLQFCKELINLYHFHRFDDIGKTQDTKKMDPTFKKRHETASEVVIHLLLAAANGDVTAIQRAWMHDVDLSVGDYDGRTPLHLAAAEGHFETVKFLLSKCKVNPNPKDRWNRTPYSESKELNYDKISQYIHGYIITNPDYEGNGVNGDEEDED